MFRPRPRLAAAGLFLGLSACGIFPSATNFAVLDVGTNEIYVGELKTVYGEPTGDVELRACRDTSPARALPARAMLAPVERERSGH